MGSPASDTLPVASASPPRIGHDLPAPDAPRRASPPRSPLSSAAFADPVPIDDPGFTDAITEQLRTALPDEHVVVVGPQRLTIGNVGFTVNLGAPVAGVPRGRRRGATPSPRASSPA